MYNFKKVLLKISIILLHLHSSLPLQKTYCQVVQCHRSLQKKTQKKKIIIHCSHQKRRETRGLNAP